MSVLRKHLTVTVRAEVLNMNRLIRPLLHKKSANWLVQRLLNQSSVCCINETPDQFPSKNTSKTPIKLNYILNEEEKAKGRNSLGYKSFGYIFIAAFCGVIYVWHTLQSKPDFHAADVRGVPLDELAVRLRHFPAKLQLWLKEKLKKPRPVAEYLDEE